MHGCVLQILRPNTDRTRTGHYFSADRSRQRLCSNFWGIYSQRARMSRNSLDAELTPHVEQIRGGGRVVGQGLSQRRVDALQAGSRGLAELGE